MSQADLTSADFRFAALTGANLAGAEIRRAHFDRTTSLGFTAAQLYSTASYQAHDLTGVRLGGNDLSGWNFTGQNLVGADFHSATLTGADLSHANLTYVSFHAARLTGADLTGAEIRRASFGSTTSLGFTAAQLYSTASYQAHDLTGVQLGSNDLSTWNLAGQNLTNASFISATLAGADLGQANLTGVYLESARLTDANLTGAEIRSALFGSTTSLGFTAAQLYTTASYQAHDLTGVQLGSNNLSGWNFAGQNLEGASFSSATLGGANLSHANLTNVSFHAARLTGADLTGADVRGAVGLGLNAGFADTTNMIGVDGTVIGLRLDVGQMLAVRDYDGNADSPTPQGPVPITIERYFTIAAGGMLRLVFEDDAWDSLISFESGIEVTLGGMLELRFAEGVQPAGHLDRTVQLFNWTGVAPSGTFTVVSPYTWDLTHLYTTGQVRLIAVAEPTGFLLAAVASLGGIVASRRREA